MSALPQGHKVLTNAETLNGLQAATSGANAHVLATDASGKLSIQSMAANESATLGDELLSAANWTSINWTGDWATGWIHTTTFTNALTNTLAGVVNNYYQITYTVTDRTVGTFTISFGGQVTGALSATGAFGPRATTTGNLIITPTADFDGKIVISIKQITGNSISTFALYDSANASNIEIRSSLSSLNNAFVGKSAGAKNTTGNHNTANGSQVLYSNTTGSYNTANGSQVLYSNTTGNQNTAIGLNALYSNTTGSYNTAIGQNALYSNTTGNYNTANGLQALYSNTTGNHNTANGSHALYSNTTGNHNTANGSQVLYSNTTGSYNTANGSQVLYSNTTGNQNTAIGLNALYSNTTGSYNTAIGQNAGRTITTGSSNTFVGNGAGFTGQLATAANSMALGNGAVTTASNQVVIGNDDITQTLLRGNVGIGLTPTDNMVGLSIEQGCVTLKERATPTADAGYGKIYCKSDNKLYFQDGAGVEHAITMS